jgi:hypothetical protein
VVVLRCHRAAQLAKQAKVAGTAASEAKVVVAEARSQMMVLLHQLRGEATDQASAQSDRDVPGLRALGDELRQMASSSGQNGLATDLARQAADRVHSVAGWLDERQPTEVLDKVRHFARRRRRGTPASTQSRPPRSGPPPGRRTPGSPARGTRSRTPRPRRPRAASGCLGVEYPEGVGYRQGLR